MVKSRKSSCCCTFRQQSFADSKFGGQLSCSSLICKVFIVTQPPGLRSALYYMSTMKRLHMVRKNGKRIVMANIY